MAGAALLSFGAYSSVRISYAEFLFHRNTTEAVERAVQLDPGNGRYQAWLAERLENEGQDGTAALERAARLNPLDSRVWIRRGLNAETNGQRVEAGRLLLHAAAIDRLMEPRWTLMNFYFRGGEEDAFWRWAKETFAISYGDRTPLFELCWRVRAEAGLIERRALPPKYPILIQFTEFLLDRGRVTEAASLAERILPGANPGDRKTFFRGVDRLLDSGDSGRAVRLWNAICDRGLLPLRSLNPAAGVSLTNAGFEHDPAGVGFDWRIPSTPGVTALRMRDPDRMRFSFDGQQAEACDPMSQTAPLEPSRKYRLRFLYRTSGIAAGSGVRVRALDQTTPDLASEEWTGQELTFAAGGRELGPIVVEYRRRPGFVRVEGTLELRGVTLGFAE